jgi:hypothetical protein
MKQIEYLGKDNKSYDAYIFEGQTIEQMPNLTYCSYTPLNTLDIAKQRIRHSDRKNKIFKTILEDQGHITKAKLENQLTKMQIKDLEESIGKEKLQKHPLYGIAKKASESDKKWSGDYCDSCDGNAMDKYGNMKIDLNSQNLLEISPLSAICKNSGTLQLNEDNKAKKFKQLPSQKDNLKLYFTKEEIEKYVNLPNTIDYIKENLLLVTLFRGDTQTLTEYAKLIMRKTNSEEICKTITPSYIPPSDSENLWTLMGINTLNRFKGDIVCNQTGMLDCFGGMLIGILRQNTYQPY